MSSITWPRLFNALGDIWELEPDYWFVPIKHWLESGDASAERSCTFKPKDKIETSTFVLERSYAMTRSAANIIN